MTKIWYILLFILIIGLVFYDNVWWAEYDLSNRGIERKTQIFGKIINISKDHFYLYTDGLNIKIDSSNIPDVKETMYGESTIYILQKGDGTFVALDYHNYNYNYLLYFFSLIAFIIFLIIFFREWRLTLRGFEDA